MRKNTAHGAILAILMTALGVRAAGGGAASDARQEDARAARRTPVVEVFETCRDAVVNITATEVVEVRSRGFESLLDQFFDMPLRPPRTQQYTRVSAGSGFVIHPDGYIVTNAHVVARTAERKAIFADGREYDAELVALDPERDLAVLKIDAENEVRPLRLGRSDDLMIGETAIAIGNPFGYQHTVTAGVVSAVNRDLDFNREVTLRGLIQTDASINPGNSGGPLLNLLGELIGVNTAIRGDAQNIGFAIPVDQLREVLPAILDVERRYRFVLGFALASPKGEGALRVDQVKARTPAERAGLRAGDLLKEIAGRAVTEPVDLHIALIGHKAGDAIPIRLERSGRGVETTLVLEERPRPDGASLLSHRFGLRVAPLSAEMARTFRVPRGRGLQITSVEPGSPAAETSLRPSDVLVSLGRSSELRIDDLGMMLEFVDTGTTLPITVRRLELGVLYQETLTLRAR
jgi:serine protease Do